MPAHGTGLLAEFWLYIWCASNYKEEINWLIFLMFCIILAFDREIMVRSHRNLLGVHSFPRWLQSPFCSSVYTPSLSEMFSLAGRRQDRLHGEKPCAIVALPCASSYVADGVRYGRCSPGPYCLQYNNAKWSICAAGVWIWGTNRVILNLFHRILRDETLNYRSGIVF